MKIKPIRDLYFRFIRHTEFEQKINAQDLAVALHLEGCIDLVPHNTKPLVEHYTDTNDFAALDTADQCAKVYSIMQVMS